MEAVAEPKVVLAKPDEDPFALPPEIMKWLGSNETRVHPDGVRRPRRMGRPGGGKPSATSLLGMFNAQGGLCCYCTQPMTLPPKSFRLRKKWPTDAVATDMIEQTMVTRDHLQPKADGGPGLLENFAAACRMCNAQKGDLPLVIFLIARATNTLGEAHRRQAPIRAALNAQKIARENALKSE